MGIVATVKLRTISQADLNCAFYRRYRTIKYVSHCKGKATRIFLRGHRRHPLHSTIDERCLSLTWLKQPHVAENAICAEQAVTVNEIDES